MAFRMGSPPNEPERYGNEPSHQQVIPRRFAIADTEVTVEQYQEFVKENPGANRARNDHRQPGPERPDEWSELVSCRGLLQLAEPEGAPAGVLRAERAGPVCPGDADQGRRLEIGRISLADRGGMGVCRPRRGHDQPALRCSRSASWGNMPGIWETATIEPGPSGALLPNDLGLFDMLGNMYEWCQEAYDKARSDRLQNHMNILNESPRLLRGGSFINPPAYVRSAYRIWYAPSHRIINCGFRPARTYD